MPIKGPIPAVAISVLIGIVAAACSGDDDDDAPLQVNSGTVLTNATVVDTRDGSLKSGVNVVIDGGKIKQIASGRVATGGTAQTVDATGKYVVPGFLDMHTHVFNASTYSAAEMASVQKLLVANGVTGVREMGGSPTWLPLAASLNADRAAGKLVTPEILTMPGRVIGIGPTGNAAFDVGAPVAAANSASAAAQEVQAQKAYGAGFIKTINANRDALLGMIGEAKNQGLSVAGHLNPALSARDSSAAGWRAVEHLGGGQGELLDCAGQESSIRATILSGAPTTLPTSWSSSTAVYQSIVDSYDAGKCEALAQTFAKNATWQIPTLIRLRGQHFVDDASYQSDPNLMYVSKVTRATWRAAAQQRLATVPAIGISTYHQYFNLQRSIPLIFKRNGVKMLAGSDMSISPAISAAWVIPGVALHQEFALLAAGGLAPLDILQMTTLNGAQFLGREATMGTVDEGKNADLVLLEGNPITDVTNLDKIAGVVLAGKYLSKATLDQMKSDVAAAYAAQPDVSPTSVTYVDHQD